MGNSETKEERPVIKTDLPMRPKQSVDTPDEIFTPTSPGPVKPLELMIKVESSQDQELKRTQSCIILCREEIIEKVNEIFSRYDYD